jgi:hypothetical protein
LFFSSKGRKNFGPLATLTWLAVHILCMAIAAGCQIDFRREGDLNLKPPLNAFF